MSHISEFLILADIEGFFGIVFFLIAFVGWVINLVNQNQEQNKQQRKRPPQRAGQRRKQNVQSEIDEFLSQSRRNNKGGNRSSETDEVEVIAPPSGRRPPPRRRKTREEVWEEQTGNAPSRPAKTPPKNKGRGLASRHLESSQEKKKPKKPKRIERSSTISKQVEQDLPHSVDAHVSNHLHAFTAEDPKSAGQIGLASTTTNRKSKGSAIGQLLKSKSGVRNAILMQEILARPKSLRK